MRHLVVLIFALLAAAGRLAAQVHITGSIDGNTVHYKVTGLQAGSKYKVTVQHDRKNGQSSSKTQQADRDGTVKGSGTPGNDPIRPGDSVTLSIQDSNGNQVGSKSFEKPVPKDSKKNSFIDYIPLVGWLARVLGF